MLAGDNSAFEFHSLVGTQLASRTDRRTRYSDILVNEVNLIKMIYIRSRYNF